MSMTTRSVAPFLMFEGRCEEAMTFYVSLFEDGEVLDTQRYGAEGPGAEGSVAQARFRLAGQEIRCMDSTVRHEFGFTPATSLFVSCATAEEVDELFEALAEGGAVLMPLQAYPFARRYAWVNDRYGVSWQLAHEDAGDASA